MLFKKPQATPMPYPNELANILNKQAALDAKQRLANWSLLNPEKISLGKYREQLKDFAVISATDGNHGRALAAAAQSSGFPCTIVIHAHVSEEREQAIAKEDANKSPM